MSRFKSAVLASSLLLAFDPALAAQRVFVSSGGNDANACTLTAPCRSFAAAHAVVDAGGEIVALDAAGYGAITITKSVTITANAGFYAGIAASTGNAITIATPDVDVTLRGLNLNGIGAVQGVNMTAGASLNVENCLITNFLNRGITVDNVASVRVVNTLVRKSGIGILMQDDVKADIVGSQFMNNGIGVYLEPTVGAGTLSVTDSVASGGSFGFVASGAQAKVSVLRSTAANNATVGFHSQTGGTMSVGYSQATNNGIGFNVNGGSVFESMGNNLVRGNTTNISGALAPIAGS